MAIDHRALLHDLTEALKRTEGQDTPSRHEAIRAVMQKHGATDEDVARLLQRARTQQRSQIQGLTSRLGSLIAQREEAASTVDAVEEFLRSRRS